MNLINYPVLSSSLVMTLDIMSQLLTHVFSSSQQHHRVLLEKQRIVDISVSCSHRSLIDHNGFGLPYFQNGHTGDRTVRILDSRWVYNIIGTNNENQVSLWEIFIDFFHLKDDIVWDTDFSEKDIHLSRHSTSNGMNGESYIDSILAKCFGHFSDGVLSLCYSHPITRNDDDIFAIN